MATPALSDELCIEAVEAYQTHHTMRAAAKALGIPDGTFSHRHATAYPVT